MVTATRSPLTRASIKAEEKAANVRHLRSILIPPPVRDITVQCPRCKALQTIEMKGELMMRTRKFAQRDGGIWHDCGSTSPCRLFEVGRV